MICDTFLNFAVTFVLLYNLIIIIRLNSHVHKRDF